MAQNVKPSPKAQVTRGETETSLSRREKELEATTKLLAQAGDILSRVDESFQLRGLVRREYPTFSSSEVLKGGLLGVGGFAEVWEISEFRLRIPKEVELPIVTTSQENRIDSECSNMLEHVHSYDGDVKGRTFSVPLHEGNQHLKQVSITCQDFDDDASKSTQSDTHAKRSLDGGNRRESSDSLESQEHDDPHYEVRRARHLMAHNVKRNGSARYAIKRLHKDLSDLERTRGMIDMALEAEYLSVLWHPNIVKMRGFASGPFLDPRFFIVMDRLYEILDAKIKRWAETESKHSGGLLGILGNKPVLNQLLIERLIVAYDLAAAFCYMHDNRDIKQENIGFDIRGDVKIFDFGLSKSLLPSDKAKNSHGRESYGYQLTPRTGSIPYMAPEVAECHPYDTKCDVFSFAILLWEILMMKPAFKGYSRREFLLRVVRNNDRPIIKRGWPPLTRLALRDGWVGDPQQRPDMKRIASLLRGDLNELSNDPKIVDRTNHMRDRSSHSARLSRALRFGLIGESKK